jgi:hypothetical protein
LKKTFTKLRAGGVLNVQALNSSPSTANKTKQNKTKTTPKKPKIKKQQNPNII